MDVVKKMKKSVLINRCLTENCQLNVLKVPLALSTKYKAMWLKLFRCVRVLLYKTQRTDLVDS